MEKLDMTQVEKKLHEKSQTYENSKIYDCVDCRDTGFIHIEKDGADYSTDCHCRIKRLKKIRSDRAKLITEIPPRFKGVGYDDFEAGWQDRPLRFCQKYAKVFPDFLPGGKNEGKSLYICGDFGVGKSHLAYSILNELARKGQPVIGFSVRDMLEKLRDYEHSQKRDELENHIKNIDLLVLDDLSRVRSTPWVDEIVADIIDERYRCLRPMVITSNLSLKGLAEKHSSIEWQSVVSRLTEICYVVECKAGEKGSYREVGNR